MAGLPCMSNDGKGAVFTGTFLQNGDSVALCEDCLPEFLVAVAGQMLGVELDQLQAAIAGLQGEQPEHPEAAGAEAAYPPHQASHGAPTDEPPAPAPADTDQDSTTDTGEQAESPPDTVTEDTAAGV